MKTMTQTLENHKHTAAYAGSINKPGMIPEVGEVCTGGGQTLTCTDINISADGLVKITFDNGQKVSGTQFAQWNAEGVVKIN